MKWDKRDISPIVLFVYNRPRETERTLAALKDNYLAKYSEIYVFCDGPKNELSADDVEKTRKVVREIDGFKRVRVFESRENKGLAKSIISGVSQVIEKHQTVIVLEDDLITSPNFLDFMNEALSFYENDEKIFSISGFTLPLKNMPMGSDFYLGYRASSWAWGTWQRVWQDVDWDLDNIEEFLNDRKAKKDFNRGGSDMTKMLKDQLNGKIDSWAIRFCYHQFKKNMLTVFPTISKAKSIGFSEKATHTYNESRFRTDLDTQCKIEFVFEKSVAVDPQLASSFRDFFSIRVRAKDRLLKYSKKFNLL